MFYSFGRSIHWLTCLVAIALITPTIIPLPFLGIAHAQNSSAEWSNLFAQAQKLESEDKYLEAENIYRQILSAPRPASMNDYMYYYIQIQFGQILQTQGKFTEAIEVLQRVIKSTINIPESQNQARRILTRVLEKQQNANELVARGLQELRNDPFTQRGYYDLARGLAAQGQLANGFTFLETNLGRPLTPESALQLARAANSLNGSGYRSWSSVRQDAIALYRQLVNRYPNQQTARAEFIDLLTLAGRRAEVVALYQEQVQTSPPESRPMLELARALVENNQIQEAIAVYDQILSQGSENPRIYMELGALLERNQQSDRALQIYLQGIQASPRDTTNDPRCHGTHRTSYDSLVSLLAGQNRLDQILPILEQSFPNPPEAAYASLALSLAYPYRLSRRGTRPPGNQPEQYRIQAEAVNQRRIERYPDPDPTEEMWQGSVETWEGGCGGDSIY